jgi:hypothetical protein
MFLTTILLLASLPLPPGDEEIIAAQTPLYPLATCVVSGEPLGGMGEVLDVVHDGRLVKLCCKGCVKKLAADGDAVVAKLDAAAIAAQKPDYPLDVCLVSGEAFGGDMGDPIEMVHEGRFVKLCCGGCKKGMARDADALLAKLDAATMAAQRERYPLATCSISGEALDDDAVEVLYGTKLVKLCCKGCVKRFHKDPQSTLDLLAAASTRRGGDRGGAGHDGDSGHEGRGEQGGRGEHEGHGEHGGRGDHEGNGRGVARSGNG